jgi:hypothetical protein
MEKALIKAIKKMFDENWTSLELGSSQADRVEAYVLGTIKDVLQDELQDLLQETNNIEKNLNMLHNQIKDMDEDLSIALDIMTDKEVKEFIRITENLNR